MGNTETQRTEGREVKGQRGRGGASGNSVVKTHTHTHSFSLSLIRRRSPAARVTRFAHFLQLALTHGLRREREGTGNGGRAQGPRGGKKKNGTRAEHRDVSGLLLSPANTASRGQKPALFRRVRVTYRGTEARRLSRGKARAGGWKRSSNPGWLGAAARALSHPDPGETHTQGPRGKLRSSA